MLDTDTSNYIMKGYPEAPRMWLAQIDNDQVAISAVVQAEIEYGLKPLPEHHPLHLKAQRFLSGIAVLAWDGAAASIFAEVRYRMKTRGTPIAERDLMIAAHAIALGAVLVTNNTRHYERLAPDLTIENWVNDTTS